eukprot:7317543-Ditylum_brightwellii.AAC.1
MDNRDKLMVDTNSGCNVFLPDAYRSNMTYSWHTFLFNAEGGQCICRAMIEAQLLAHLICLAIREKSPPLLQNAFPGAFVSLDMAEAMVKTEIPPLLHLLLVGTTVGMGNAAK